MLAHQIDAVGAEFSRVERAASKPGNSSGVRCFAKELDPHTVGGRRPDIRNGGIRVGMPVQHSIQVVEQALACHIDFGPFGLLGGAAKDTQRAGNMVCGCQIFQRDRCPDGGGSKQIMAAAMAARDMVFARLLMRNRFVAEPWQRIVFDQHAENGPVSSPFCDEGGGYPSCALAGDRKAFFP